MGWHVRWSYTGFLSSQVFRLRGGQAWATDILNTLLTRIVPSLNILSQNAWQQFYWRKRKNENGTLLMETKPE